MEIDVKKTAAPAKLSVEGFDIAEIVRDMSAIPAFADEIDKIDLSAEDCERSESGAVLRKDVPGVSLNRDELLREVGDTEYYIAPNRTGVSE